MATSASKTTPAAVVEDYLDEDQEIPGQKFVLLSFLSPESVIARKDHFFFQEFLKSYELEWKIKGLEKFLATTVIDINKQLEEHVTALEKDGQTAAAEICRKNYLKVEDVLTPYQEFVKKNQREINKTKITEAWDDFLFANRERLEAEFHAANDFQTSMRGLKVRGVAGSQKEAEIRAKKIQQKDKYHNILLGEVGKWLPWDPAPSQVSEQEYAQQELNTLMQKYKENEDAKEKFFEERKKGGAGAKKVIGMGGETGGAAGGAAASLEDAVGNMFGATGDLALQRKMEQKKVIEVVEDAGAAGASESKKED